MATSFYGGAFFGGEFFSAGSGSTPPPVVTVKTGTGGIDPPRVYKPTGIANRKKVSLRKTVEDRVEESREIHREIARAPKFELLPIPQMSVTQIHAEIGARLKQKMLEDENEMILMMLISAAD